jgi:hypothetical protein
VEGERGGFFFLGRRWIVQEGEGRIKRDIKMRIRFWVK